MEWNQDSAKREARQIVCRLASRVFLEDEEIESFVAFLDREGLLLSWGEKLNVCFTAPSSSPNNAETNMFIAIAKQVFRQFESAQPSNGRAQCSVDEAEHLIAFTRALLHEFVRENLHRINNIIDQIASELRSLFLIKQAGNWEQVSALLSLSELKKFESESRAGISGEKVSIPNEIESGYPRQNEEQNRKMEGQIVWDAHPDKLEWLGVHLETSLNWINSGEGWKRFFTFNCEFIGQVECINIHQGKIALLILLLKEARKMKVIKAKGFWTSIQRQFKGQEKSPWKRDWARVASEAGKDDRILRNFWRDVKVLLKHLDIEKEDIPKFLGRIGEVIEED